MRKVALVTGGSRGIGLGIARCLASDECDVVTCGVRPERDVSPAMEELRALGAQVQYYQADVSDSDARSRMLQRIQDQFGRLNVLVNNAGVAPKIRTDILESTQESFERVMHINLQGPYFLTQAVARWMIELRRDNPTFEATIVNISSIAGFGAIDCLVPYCVSKGGMHSITTAMATELGPYGIRVNALAPGPIDTERNRQTDPAFPGSCKPFIPRGQVGSVEEVAKPAIFLASDEASHITGQCFSVDGGQTAYIPMSRADFAR